MTQQLASANNSTSPELVIQRGHSKGVVAVAFSPDGYFAVTASEDHTAILWDVSTGDTLRVLEGHRGPLSSAAITPDGGRVITGSVDKSAMVWDWSTGRIIHSLEGHTKEVTALSLSRDGRSIATGSSDSSIIVWDAWSGQRLQTFLDLARGSARGVRGVVFCSNDQQLFVEYAFGIGASLFDVATGIVVHRFPSSKFCFGVACSPDGHNVVSGANVWDLRARARSLKLVDFLGEISSVTYSADGTIIGAGLTNHSAILWDATTGRTLRSFVPHPGSDTSPFTGHVGRVTSIGIRGDGQYVLTGSIDSTAILWN